MVVSISVSDFSDEVTLTESDALSICEEEFDRPAGDYLKVRQAKNKLAEGYEDGRARRVVSFYRPLYLANNLQVIGYSLFARDWDTAALKS